MDNHNSYMIANFIAFHLRYLIGWFILCLFISHLFQFFDVDVFMLLKHVLIETNEAIFWFDFSRIVHGNKVSRFIWFSSQILISKNLFVAWKNIKLTLFRFWEIFQELSFQWIFMFLWLSIFAKTNVLNIIVICKFFFR